MADTNFRGPVSNMGAMEDSPSNVQPLDGPLYSYQGVAIADINAVPFNKDGAGAGRVPAILSNPTILCVNNIPQARSTTAIAAATTVVTATPLTLTTVAPGGSGAGVPSLGVAIPIVPFGGSVVSTAALAIDFGFTTGTTAAGSGSVLVPDTTLFTAGQWIIVGGAGNSGKTASLITQVQSIAATSIVISPVAVGTLSNAPIAGANLFNQFLPPATQFGAPASVPTAWSPHVVAGLLRLQESKEMLARCVSIGATSTAAAGGAFTVNGWDIYRQPMSETITVGASTTAVTYGQKAFKFIKNIVPNFTDTTGQYSVGIGDTFGFPFRDDLWESTRMMYGGTQIVTNVGWLGAVTTNPATATTGDVRGTVQLSANGAHTAIAAPVVGTTDGAKRLVIVQTLPMWNTINATPLNRAPLYGVTQV